MLATIKNKSHTVLADVALEKFYVDSTIYKMQFTLTQYPDLDRLMTMKMGLPYDITIGSHPTIENLICISCSMTTMFQSARKIWVIDTEWTKKPKTNKKWKKLGF